MLSDPEQFVVDVGYLDPVDHPDAFPDDDLLAELDEHGPEGNVRRGLRHHHRSQTDWSREDPNGWEIDVSGPGEWF